MPAGERVFVVEFRGYQEDATEGVYATLAGAMAAYPESGWAAPAYQRGPRFLKPIPFTPELAAEHPDWQWEETWSDGGSTGFRVILPMTVQE